MKGSEVHLLCTGKMAQSTSKAGQPAIVTDIIPFIRTESLKDDHLKSIVQQIAKSSTSVIFTSRNAVNSVIALLEGLQPLWTIFCIGNGTRKEITENFRNSDVQGVAENASLLSDVVVNSRVSDCVFFCGDHRLDELPERLEKANVQVREVVVYKTVLTPVKVTKEYDGILFFSPSGVDSFFSANIVKDDCVFFALGETTASRLRQNAGNRVIVSGIAQKETLLQEAIAYFEKT